MDRNHTAKNDAGVGHKLNSDGKALELLAREAIHARDAHNRACNDIQLHNGQRLLHKLLELQAKLLLDRQDSLAHDLITEMRYAVPYATCHLPAEVHVGASIRCVL